ncbi:MAG: oligosaccharide flippase family protein [Planctomycetota bacterium]
MTKVSPIGRSAVVITAARGLGLVASFLVTLLFTRILGSVEFGIYMVATAWALMLAILAQLGMDRLLSREVAFLVDQRDPRSIRLMIWWSIGRVSLIAWPLAAIAFATFLLSPLAGSGHARFAAALAMALIPISGYTAIIKGALSGFGRVAVAQALSDLFNPLVLLTLTVSGGLLWFEAGTGITAVGLAVSSAFVCAAIGAAILLFVCRRFDSQTISAGDALPPRLLSKSLAFTWIAGMNALLAHADIVMVGAFTDDATAGVYGLSSYLGSIGTALSVALGAATTPRLAVAFRKRQLAEAQKISLAMALVTGVSTVLYLLFLLILGRHVLWVFGADFIAGWPAACVITAGYAIGSCCGPTGHLLNMAGKEAVTARSMVVAVAANIVLNLALIPLLGILGAALATGLVVVGRNIYLVWVIRRRVGIDPTILGLLWLRRGAGV